jgi:glucans biosynthesis protein C
MAGLQVKPDERVEFVVIGTATSADAAEVRGEKTGPRTQSRSSSRLECLDALRVALIVLVVAHHAGQAYGAGAGGLWPVSDPDKAAIFSSFFSVNAAFFMGLFFLMSAYFVPASFDRKGPAAFLKDRFIRLGGPLVFFLVIGGLAGLAGFALDTLNAGAPETFLSRIAEFAFEFAFGQWHLGQLWFVEQLLLYVTLYAAWRLVTARWSIGELPVPGNAAIVGFALALAVMTFVVRIEYPINRWVYPFGLLAAEVGHLPQYASMFVVGLLAYRGQWLERMPTRRGMLWLGIGIAGAAMRYLLPIGTPGGLSVSSLIWSTCEALIAIGLCLGLIVLFREYVAAPNRLVRMAAPNTYGVYIIHVFVVLPLQLGLLTVTAPAQLKFALVTVVALLVSFALTTLLRQLPGVRAVL